jgi:hypothetical protein
MPMNSPFGETAFRDLELSPRPAERAAQVRVLKDVFSVLERHRLERRTMGWSFLVKVADSPAIAAAVDALVDGIPADEDFGSFEALKARRDANGVARSRR